jgi:hypothetical protein
MAIVVPSPLITANMMRRSWKPSLQERQQGHSDTDRDAQKARKDE